MNGGLKPVLIYRLIMDMYLIVAPIKPELGEYLTSVIGILLPTFIYMYATRYVDDDIEVLDSFEEKKEKEQQQSTNNQTLKILIVDDNKLNIKVAKKTISDLNAEIDECYDGQECINKIKDGNEYNIILMDIMMPGTDGEKTISILKQNPNFKIPTIAVTADAVAGAKEKYLSEGFSDYISKPFHKEEIIEKINNLMNTA